MKFFIEVYIFVRYDEPRHSAAPRSRVLCRQWWPPFSTHSHLSQAQNLITNGNFQNGFAGWARSGAQDFQDTGDLFSAYGLTPPDPSVTALAALGPQLSDGFLTQTINGTQPGTGYRLTFFLNNKFGGSPASPGDFTVSYNGVSLGITASGDPTISVPLLNAAAFGGTSFLEFTTVVSSTSGPQTLEFSFRNPPGYWFLTGVSYTCALCGASPNVLCDQKLIMGCSPIDPAEYSR